MHTHMVHTYTPAAVGGVWVVCESVYIVYLRMFLQTRSRLAVACVCFSFSVALFVYFQHGHIRCQGGWCVALPALSGTLNALIALLQGG